MRLKLCNLLRRCDKSYQHARGIGADCENLDEINKKLWRWQKKAAQKTYLGFINRGISNKVSNHSLFHKIFKTVWLARVHWLILGGTLEKGCQGPGGEVVKMHWNCAMIVGFQLCGKKDMSLFLEKKRIRDAISVFKTDGFWWNNKGESVYSGKRKSDLCTLGKKDRNMTWTSENNF